MKKFKGVPMGQYYGLLNHIEKKGTNSDDRTGVGTRSVFGKQIRFDLNEGFPILTGKFTPFGLVAAELMWFLSGSTSNDDLSALNKKWANSTRGTIWKEWAGENNYLGPIYGKQWRKWGINRIDQISQLIDDIVNAPNSRRLIVSAWNVDNLPSEAISPQENVKMGKMALAPCHALFQFYVRNGTLSCHLYQRSCDVFLGLPFNIASYALLTHLVAHVVSARTGRVLNVGELIISFGDVHIYNNHREQVKTLLARAKSEEILNHLMPQLVFEKGVSRNSIFDFDYGDFYLTPYKSMPHITAKVAV